MEDMRAELAATRARMLELERSREEQAQALEVERQAREDAESEPINFSEVKLYRFIIVC